MRNNITFERHAQYDFPAYHRRRSMGHRVGCGCEACFVFVERAISRYLPGHLPPDPLVQRLKELEGENAQLRSQNEQLHRATRATTPHSNYSHEPQRHMHDSAAFEPVVIG